MKTAHLFPAFVPEYLGIETSVIGHHILMHKLEKVSAVAGRDITDFDIENHNYLDDPLTSQFITYVMSCCVSDILHKNDKVPDFVSAFSMGIYAALYHCRSISFETGMQMIISAYNYIEKHLPAEMMGMCVIGGLSRDDVEGIMRSYVDKVSIINQNSEFSFILSGHAQALLRIIDNAKADGALQTRMLPVTHPYHSPLLQKASVDFGAKIEMMTVSKSIYPIVSAMDQKTIRTEDQIRSELVRNLCQPFHWWKTLTFMAGSGVDKFIECGAGESLYKVGKFIPGDFSILNLKKMAKYINEEGI